MVQRAMRAELQQELEPRCVELDTAHAFRSPLRVLAPAWHKVVDLFDDPGPQDVAGATGATQLEAAVAFAQRAPPRALRPGDRCLVCQPEGAKAGTVVAAEGTFAHVQFEPGERYTCLEPGDVAWTVAV